MIEDKQDKNSHYLVMSGKGLRSKQFQEKVLDAKEKLDQANEIIRKNLENFCKASVKTTMIGAIAAFEKCFEDCTDEQREMFAKAREEVLDLGNKHIRKVENEINKHDVSKRIYSVIFKVKGE